MDYLFTFFQFNNFDNNNLDFFFKFPNYLEINLNYCYADNKNYVFFSVNLEHKNLVNHLFILYHLNTFIKVNVASKILLLFYILIFSAVTILLTTTTVSVLTLTFFTKTFSSFSITAPNVSSIFPTIRITF